MSRLQLAFRSHLVLGEFRSKTPYGKLKGPSDTTTKLIDSVEEQLGTRPPQTIATARLLSIGAVAFHRSNKILSSKATSEYATLYDYRHPANNRFNMAGSLTRLLEFVTDDYQHLVVPLPMGTRVTFALPSSNLVPPNTPPRRTSAADEASQQVSWSY
jgi:hypothetical protein